MEYKNNIKRINKSRLTFSQQTQVPHSNIFFENKTENHSLHDRKKLIQQISQTRKYNMVGNKESFLNYLKNMEIEQKKLEEQQKKYFRSGALLMNKPNEEKKMMMHLLIKQIGNIGQNQNSASTRRKRKDRINKKIREITQEKLRSQYYSWQKSLRQSPIMRSRAGSIDIFKRKSQSLIKQKRQPFKIILSSQNTPKTSFHKKRIFHRIL